jgi:hypothetical protein
MLGGKGKEIISFEGAELLMPKFSSFDGTEKN